MTVTVKSETTIKVELQFDGVQTGRHEEYVWTLEEAIAIKDELIRLVGAQSRPFTTTPVNQIDQNKMASEPKKRSCQCGGPARASNGACGPSGCNNVPA